MCIDYLWRDISKTDNVGYLCREEIGGKETFHPNQQAPYCKENTFLELGEKKNPIKFWSCANLLNPFYILHNPFQCSDTNYSSIFWLPGDPSSRTQF